LMLMGVQPRAMTPFYLLAVNSESIAKFEENLTKELLVQQTGCSVQEVPLRPMPVMGVQVTKIY
jgi:hypothetical protein